MLLVLDDLLTMLILLTQCQVDLEEIRLSISEHLEGQRGLNDGYVQFVKYQAEKGFTSAQVQIRLTKSPISS